MKKTIKISGFILMISLIFLYHDSVYAAEYTLSQNFICAGNQLYKVNQSQTGSAVRNLLSYIQEADLVGNATLGLPEMCYCSGDSTACKNINGQCNARYKIKADLQNTACRITQGAIGNNSYTFRTCPVDENDYNLTSKIERALTYEFDHSAYAWKIKVDSRLISDADLNKIIIKSARRSGGDFAINPRNGEVTDVAATYTGQQLKAGIYWIPGTSYYFGIYLASGECEGVSIGHIRGGVSSNVDNPMYNNQICINYRSRHAAESVEALLVPECYQEKILANNYSNIASIIQGKIQKVQDLNLGYQTTTQGSAAYTCQFKNSDADNTTNVQNSLSSYKYFLDGLGGKYWKALCTETLSLSYDDPKPVNAGGGFSYTSIITIVRECTPYKIAEPVYYPKCLYTAECWGGPANHNGEPGAGPTEEFDECINRCDGGKYTQDCINSCYQKVYGSNKSARLSSNNDLIVSFLNTTKRNNIVRLASGLEGYVPKGIAQDYGTEHPRLPQSSACVISSNTATGCGISCQPELNRCTTEHGVGIGYFSACNANGSSSATMCYEVFTNYPCTEGDPAKEYKVQVIQASNEFDQVVAGIQSFSNDQIKDEKYSLGVDEKYTLKKNGGYLNNKTTYFTNDSNPNKIDSTAEEKILETKDPQTVRIAEIISEAGMSAEFINRYVNKTYATYVVERKITLNLGQAYVPKTTGGTVLYNQTNDKSDTRLDNNKLYYNGSYKYYTHLDTQPINNYNKWPYLYTYAHYTNPNGVSSGYTNNIHLKLNNIGSWNQWGNVDSRQNVNVDCFYGVVNKYNACEDGSEPICDANSICTCGIQYVYRTIDLTDVFPNDRDPRWNWTGKILSSDKATGAALTLNQSGLGYKVDPEATTSHIESKGESIYDVKADSGEVDYEFVLTKANLNNIRKYNKRVKDYNGDNYNNYLDYNMSCYIRNDREICTSKFLDNIDGSSGGESAAEFITYSVSGFGIDSRRSIAICNNAYAGSCVDVSSTR